jgi:3-phenylpropionate/trans-cinnamate dioxygenase ferredoxin reductase component
MGYRKLVVGTDGSVTATAARDAAIRLAKRCRAALHVVCAYDPRRMNRQVAQDVIRRSLDAASRQKVESTGEIGQADPAELILDAAERENADLIVVGNKGMGQAKRFRLGSVPDRVAHFAPCDLLIVDTTRSDRTKRADLGYKKLLAGTDGSPTASEAARKAFELAMLLRSTVTLVYVGDPVVGAITLEETAKGRPEGVKVEPLVGQGEPADVLVQVSEAADIDLIVVGNKGMSGARRFLLGSVPNQVAHYAPTDVLIAKTVDRTVDDLAPGHGGVIDLEGQKLAVFKDEAGLLVALSPRCTHMGCTVDWNDAERTWDCPCHGSRYSVEGEVIQGPAAKALPVVHVKGERKAGGAGAGIASKPHVGGRQRIVIVGAALCGGTAAATLRREGFDGHLTLIGAEQHLPYERPPLSKSFLRGETSFDDALVESAAFWPDNDLELRLGTRVTRVDPGARTVGLESGERVPFDQLLIASGARNRRFPIPGLDLPGVYDLRTVEDAERIRAEIAPGRNVVIAGMGFIGSEVAASLRQKGLSVTVIDGNVAPLSRVLGEQVGRVLEGIHRDKGVRMHFQDRVASFEGSQRVERVVTGGGLSLECDFVVVGLGVEPVTDFLEGSGVELDDGVVVDDRCRTNVHGIFAAGDVASHFNPLFGRRLRVEHWQNAIKHGQFAALNMLGAGSPYRDVYWFWSDQYEVNLQYVGYHTEWDQLVVRGSLEDRNFLAFYIKDEHVLAAVGIGRGDEVQRCAALIEAGAPVDADKLSDEQVDLPVPV